MERIRADEVRRHLHALAGGHNDPRATDRELLRRFARHRDEAAFAALFRRHGVMVLAAAGRVLGNAHDAEDVCQAAFLLLARRASSRRWQTSVAGWLYRTAHLLALKARTAAGRRARREGRAAPRPPADPLTEITGQELLAALDEELLALPRPLRAPLVLCYLEGATRDEAARQLGCPPATLKKRLERGRERLRAALARRGPGLPAVLPAALLTRRAADAAAVGVLARKTAAAAMALAAGKAADGVAPPSVSRLVRGGRGIPGWHPWKAVLPTLLLAGGLLATAGALAHGARRDGQAGPEPPAAAAPRDRDDRLPDAAPARARGTTLRYQFKPGDRLRYVVESRIETHTGAPGLEQVNVATHVCDVTWRVDGVDSEGNARVTLTVERLRFALDNSLAGRVEFDSKKHRSPVGPPGVASVQAPVLKAYAGAEFTCTVSPRGEVRDFKVPKKIADVLRKTPGLQTRYSPESFQQQLACAGCVILPGEPLPKGGRWNEKAGPAVVGGLVRLTVDTRATYRGRADRGGEPLEEVALEPAVTAAEPTPVSGLGPLTLRSQDGKGKIVFDNDRGRLVESEISQSLDLESGNRGQTAAWTIKFARSAKLVSPN